MSDFFFKGVIPSSKSLMNRALICSSHAEFLKVLGYSQCDDVQKMIQALKKFKNKEAMHCGSAGTVLRFLSFRVSRKPGCHILLGSERLFSRPQKSIVELLEILGVVSYFKDQKFIVESKEGWVIPSRPIEVDRSTSSQFASGLLLNAWGLDKDLELKWVGDIVSDGYFQMTLDVLKDLGMQIDLTEKGLVVPAGQKISEASYEVESDLSSAFAVAALAVVSGEAIMENFPLKSLQPDREFVEILKAMGADLEFKANVLRVKKTKSLKPIQWSLINCPDLFPVLSVLCALATGISELKGAPHLVHKESDRIVKSAELVRKMGRSCEITSEGMIIHGRLTGWEPQFDFDTDHDHRMAFAAGVVQRAGGQVNVLNPGVVEKSFPEFWKVLEGR